MIAGKASQYWSSVQSYLFSWMKESVGALTDKHYEVIRTLEVCRIEDFVSVPCRREVGRPPCERQAISRSFVAKAVLNFGTTEQLIERLNVDVALRRISGFEWRQDVPSSSPFSRAFSEFSESGLAQRVHESLVQRELGESIVLHNCRDSTEIEAREKPESKKTCAPKKNSPRGRPRKGAERLPRVAGNFRE